MRSITRSIRLSCAVLGVATLPAAVRAEEAGSRPASGFVFQARMPTLGSLTGSLFGTPGFLVGRRSGGLTIGAGLGLSRLVVEVGDEETSLTVWQVQPMLQYDVWTSSDGLTSLDLVGGVGYGRASVEATETAVQCGAGSGGSSCNEEHDQITAHGTVIPIRAGLGGNHFLSRHFALGLEAGWEMLMLSDLEAEGEEIDGSFSSHLFYGLIRATIVAGD